MLLPQHVLKFGFDIWSCYVYCFWLFFSFWNASRDLQVLLEHFLRIMLYEVYISSEWKTLNFVIQYYAISCLSNQIVCLAGQVLDSFRYVFHINFFLYVILIDIVLLLSGNYGGALGANALAKGLEGNKSLRVCKFSFFFFFLQFSIFYMGGVVLLYVSFCACGIFYLIITSVKLN
jgi:cation transporter-like permease